MTTVITATLTEKPNRACPAGPRRALPSRAGPSLAWVLRLPWRTRT